MPAYVGFVRIEFHVDGVSPALRVAVRAAKIALDSADHTMQTFDWRLRLFAQAHPEIGVDALVEDADRTRWLFQARRGAVIVQHVYPVLADVEHEAQIEGIAHEYDAEAELIEAVDAASNAHLDGTMVVDVGLKRYLVKLAGGGAAVLEAYPVDRALVHRLVQLEYSPEQRALSRTDDMLRLLR